MRDSMDIDLHLQVDPSEAWIAVQRHSEGKRLAAEAASASAVGLRVH